MRAVRTPSNQCHVTNLKDNPVQIAADAAEAGIRGFSEQETTVGIARYAPFNALALLVGSQCGRLACSRNVPLRRRRSWSWGCAG